MQATGKCIIFKFDQAHRTFSECQRLNPEDRMGGPLRCDAKFPPAHLLLPGGRTQCEAFSEDRVIYNEYSVIYNAMAGVSWHACSGVSWHACCSACCLSSKWSFLLSPGEQQTC
jgi:hypothetical protein